MVKLDASSAVSSSQMFPTFHHHHHTRQENIQNQTEASSKIILTSVSTIITIATIVRLTIDIWAWLTNLRTVTTYKSVLSRWCLILSGKSDKCPVLFTSCITIEHRCETVVMMWTNIPPVLIHSANNPLINLSLTTIFHLSNKKKTSIEYYFSVPIFVVLLSSQNDLFNKLSISSFTLSATAGFHSSCRHHARLQIYCSTARYHE